MAIANLRPDDVSEADRIHAKGVPIKLDDGSEVRIRFDMEALKELEKNFGELQKVINELKREGFTPNRIETSVYILKTTMLHLEWENGEHKYPGKAERLSHMLDANLLLDSTYLTALNQAMIEALPAVSAADAATADEEEEEASPNAEGSRASSPGNGSTPSPADMVAATEPSGA